jgi:hypothetical protein
VLSIVQGTQFSAQPPVVGVSLKPGQLLAPGFALAASVALGAVKAAIEIGAYGPVPAALTLLPASRAWFYFSCWRTF